MVNSLGSPVVIRFAQGCGKRAGSEGDGRKMVKCMVRKSFNGGTSFFGQARRGRMITLTNLHDGTKLATCAEIPVPGSVLDRTDPVCGGLRPFARDCFIGRVGPDQGSESQPGGFWYSGWPDPLAERGFHRRRIYPIPLSMSVT